MKKILLALIALAFAFAISSCCEQSYSRTDQKCEEIKRDHQSEAQYQCAPPPEKCHYERRQESDKQRRRW